MQETCFWIKDDRGFEVRFPGAICRRHMETVDKVGNTATHDVNQPWQK